MIDVSPSVCALALIGLFSSGISGQSTAVQLTHDHASSRSPSWHPDGTRLVYESDREGNWDLITVDRITGHEIVLTDSPADDRYPAWSPTGESVVFVSDREGTPDLYLIHVSTQRVERLARMPGEETFPAWAPDGRSVVFTLVTDSTSGLVSMSLDDRQPVALFTDARALWPRWSPTGDRLAFFSRRDTDGRDDEIYVLTVGTGAVHRITHRAGHDFCPAWDPEGRRMVLVSIDEDGTRALRVVDAEDGAEQGRLASTYHRVTEPAWSPDGRHIAYAARVSTETPYQLFLEAVPDLRRRRPLREQR